MKTLYELAGELLKRNYRVKLDVENGVQYLRVEIPPGWTVAPEKKKEMEDAKFTLI